MILPTKTFNNSSKLHLKMHGLILMVLFASDQRRWRIDNGGGCCCYIFLSYPINFFWNRDLFLWTRIYEYAPLNYRSSCDFARVRYGIHFIPRICKVTLKCLQSLCEDPKYKRILISQFGVATVHPNDAFCVGIKSSWKITSSQDYKHWSIHVKLLSNYNRIVKTFEYKNVHISLIKTYKQNFNVLRDLLSKHRRLVCIF